MFLTYTVDWLTFFGLPVIDITSSEAHVVTTVVSTADCGVNSIVYLLMDKEVRINFVSMHTKPLEERVNRQDSLHKNALISTKGTVIFLLIGKRYFNIFLCIVLGKS